MNFNEQKLRVAEALLPQCPYIVLNGKHPDITGLPDAWKQDTLVLRIGRDPNVLGMPDLLLDVDWFGGTFSSAGSLFYITVAWEAVIQMFIGEPGDGGLIITGALAVWPQVPAEAKPAAPKKPGLRVVKPE